LTDLKIISDDLTQRLGLRYVPVGVNIIRKQDDLPDGMQFSEGKLKSYCDALTVAGKGTTLLLKKEQMGCKFGTSVLGFEELAEDLLEDGVYEKFEAGLFATEEASAETIKKSTYLPKGETQAAMIAPLPKFIEVPQVVVFSADSEQVMWILYAINYDRGGVMNLPQSGGALGGCADITAFPILKGDANVTFLGLGCRIKSGLDGCHLMMGVPGTMLEMIYSNIMRMEKPMNMLKNAQQKA
jgi:uncharacterized protein (DUF169 family)